MNIDDFEQLCEVYAHTCPISIPTRDNYSYILIEESLARLENVMAILDISKITSEFMAE